MAYDFQKVFIEFLIGADPTLQPLVKEPFHWNGKLSAWNAFKPSP
jgi:hypothetical protein